MIFEVYLSLIQKKLCSFFLKQLAYNNSLQQKYTFYFFILITFYLLRGTLMEEILSDNTDRIGLKMLLIFTQFDPIKELNKLFPLADIAIFLINLFLLILLLFSKFLKNQKNLLLSSFMKVSVNFAKFYTVFDGILLRISLEIDWNSNTGLAQAIFKSLNIIFIITMSLILLSFDPELKTDSFHSMKGKLFVVILLLFKIMASITVWLVDNVALLIITLGITVLLFFIVLKLPFYHSYSNKSYLVLCCWFIISYIFQIASYFKKANISYIYFFYASYILTCFIVPKISISALEVKKMNVLLCNKINNPQVNLNRFSILANQIGKKNQGDQDSSLKKLLYQQEIQYGKQKDNMENLILRYQEKIQRHLNTQEIILINYLRIKKSNTYIKGYSQLYPLLLSNPNCLNYSSKAYINFIFKQKANLINQAANTSDKLNMENEMLYDNQCMKFTKLLFSYLEKLEQANNFLEERKNYGKIYWLGTELKNFHNNIKTNIVSLTNKFPRNNLHLLLYGFYLESFRGSYYTSRKLLKSFQNSSLLKISDNLKFNTTKILGVEKKGYLICSGKEDPGSLVMRSCSNEVIQIFGYGDIRSLIGEPIEILLSTCISDHHKNGVLKFYESGSSKVVGIDRCLPGVNSFGFCMDLNVTISILTKELRELKFLAAIRNSSNHNPFLISFPDGRIDKISEECLHIFGLTSPPKSSELNIFDYCQDLRWIYKILNYKFLQSKLGKNKLKTLLFENEQSEDQHILHVPNQLQKARNSTAQAKEGTSNVNYNDTVLYDENKISKNVLENTINPHSNRDEYTFETLHKEFINGSNCIFDFTLNQEEENTQQYIFKIVDLYILDTYIMRLLFFKNTNYNIENIKPLATKISGLQNNYNIPMSLNMKKMVNELSGVKYHEAYTIKEEKLRSDQQKNDGFALDWQKNSISNWEFSQKELTTVKSSSNTSDQIPKNNSSFVLESEDKRSLQRLKSKKEDNFQEKYSIKEEVPLANVASSLNSSILTSTGNTIKLYDFLERSFEEPIPSNFPAGNIILHICLFAILFVVNIILQTNARDKVVYTSNLRNILDVIVLRSGYAQVIFRGTVQLYLIENDYIDGDYLSLYNVTSFRSKINDKLIENSLAIYQSQFDFLNALNKFPDDFRENIMKMKETFDVFEYGQQKTVNYTYNEQFQHLIYSSRLLGLYTGVIDYTVEEVYFILKNLFNGIMINFQINFETSTDQINLILSDCHSMIQSLLLLFGIIPLVFGTSIIIFAYIMKKRMAQLLNTLFYLSENDLNLIRNKLSVIRTFLKRVSENKITVEFDDIQRILFETNLKENSRLNKTKTTLRKKNYQYNNAKINEYIYFREVQIIKILVVVWILLAGIGAIIFTVHILKLKKN